MLATPGHDGTLILAPPSRGSSDLLREWGDDDCLPRPDSDRVTLWSPAPGAIVALPQHHEPGYSYPLLIWLPEASQTETEAAGWLERISQRNYVGLGLRPALFHGSAPRIALDRLIRVVRRVESEVLIHAHRRYLAGVSEGGRTAIEWLVERPQSFAGAVAIDVASRPVFAARVQGDRMIGRRVLWASTEATGIDEPPAAELDALRALGADVNCWQPDDLGDALTQLGRQIDGWILSAIPSAIHTTTV
jgi:hypothetical protein